MLLSVPHGWFMWIKCTGHYKNRQRRKQSSCHLYTWDPTRERTLQCFGFVSDSRVRTSTHQLTCCDSLRQWRFRVTMWKRFITSYKCFAFSSTWSFNEVTALLSEYNTKTGKPLNYSQFTAIHCQSTIITGEYENMKQETFVIHTTCGCNHDRFYYKAFYYIFNLFRETYFIFPSYIIG